jgi:hypothetical protein
LFELGPRLLLVRMPLLGELAREAKQRRLVPVDPGVLGRAAAATRRPAVEALLPAVYADSFRRKTLMSPTFIWSSSSCVLPTSAQAASFAVT